MVASGPELKSAEGSIKLRDMALDTLAYRDELRPQLPRWYRGWPHFVFTNLLLGGITLALLLRVHAPRALDLLAIPAAFLASNLVEYIAHRYPLHRPLGPFRYIYKAHGIRHHRFFTGDTPEHMTTDRPFDFAVVLFGPQSQLAMLGGVGFPLTWLTGRLAGHDAAMLFGATATAYFLVYEWLHLLYHLPSSHPLTRLPGLARLQNHHRLHHEPRLMSKWNFNITFPIFDHVLGTNFHEEVTSHQPPAASHQPGGPEIESR